MTDIDYEVMSNLLNNIKENGGVIAPPSYFTQVPDAFTRRSDLSMQEKMLYIYIWGYASNKGHAFPSQARILQELGISKPTLHKILNSLEKKQGIYIVNQFKQDGGQVSNLYFLADIDITTGEFNSQYLEMNKALYPDKKRIIK